MKHVLTGFGQKFFAAGAERLNHGNGMRGRKDAVFNGDFFRHCTSGVSRAHFIVRDDDGKLPILVKRHTQRVKAFIRGKRRGEAAECHRGRVVRVTLKASTNLKELVLGKGTAEESIGGGSAGGDAGA